MTYATEKERMGRQAVYIVEFDLDFCEHTYGVAPCTAAIDVAHPDKCFNTRKTCQDATNYSATTKTYRFSNLVLPPSSDLDFIAIPALKTPISLAPTVIDPIAGIGKRAEVTFTFKDFAHPDTDVDPYLAGRSYDSATRGTFWTKLLARNPYFQNRVIRLKTGYLRDGEAPDAANFLTRYYLIQSIVGPSTAGEVKILAQDPLKMLDDDRAKAPLANSGRLLAAITSVDFTATLTPTGVGDDEYPASGVMVMGNELADFTRTADVLTFSSRGTQGTVAEAHAADESMQAALVYSGQSITEVLYDLLVTRAGVPASYVDLTQWNEEADTWLGDYTIGTTITKPVGLNQLVGELAQQCLFYIWWDEREQTIPFRALRPPHNETLPTLDDTSNILADSQSVSEKAADRRTRIWVYTGQRNPTVDLNKPYNYTDVSEAIDLDAESDTEYGDKRIGIFWSRWLLPDGDSEAEKLALRLLNRYRDNPKTYVLKIDAKDSDIWTGAVVTVTMRSVVDFTGAPVATDMQVMQVRETVPGSEYELTLQDTQFKGRYGFWAPDAEGDYPDVTEADRERYAFWASDDEVMSDGTAGYQYV
jgi:hypothetical protein